MVRLPSKEARNPRCFDFGTPYAKMRKDLAMEDEAFYRGNRVLDLLKRNEAIKAAPQQWQRLSDADVASFDVVVCFEDRVFKKVLEDIRERGEPSGLYKPVHLILMTVKDSAEESEASSSDVLRLCKTLDALENLIMDAHKSVRRLSAETPRDLQHRIVHV